MKVWLHDPEIENPKIAHHIVVIFGDAKCLKDDIKKLVTLNFDKLGFDRYSIGRSYKELGKLDHWGTVDAESSIWWAENLPDNWRNGRQTHTLGNVRGFTYDWDTDQASYDERENKWYGSSALFAALTCVAMGYRRIILAGCPIDSKGHFYSLPHELGPKWDAEDYQAWLDFNAQPEAEWVRSVSGYTAKILGYPTLEWIRKSHSMIWL